MHRKRKRDFGSISKLEFAGVWSESLNPALLHYVLALAGRQGVDVLMTDAEVGLDLDIDLGSQQITRSNGDIFQLDINPYFKDRLLRGLDDIRLTM